jgi:hypothetical protein
MKVLPAIQKIKKLKDRNSGPYVHQNSGLHVRTGILKHDVRERSVFFDPSGSLHPFFSQKKQPFDNKFIGTVSNKFRLLALQEYWQLHFSQQINQYVKERMTHAKNCLFLNRSGPLCQLFS